MCRNIVAFTIIALIRLVYGFIPTHIKHVCDNQAAIMATWKDKDKPDTDVAKFAICAITDLQYHAIVHACWTRGDTDKRDPQINWWRKRRLSYHQT
jgi:hypothetical protein